MPPKNKKQAEEEARRLEEEQLRRAEEEAKLEKERVMFGGEILSTGLLLPVSEYILTQFSSLSADLVKQKLEESISMVDKNFKSSSKKPYVIKQCLHYIVDAYKLFSLTLNKKNKNKDSALKARVFIGILVKAISVKDENFGKANYQAEAQEVIKNEILKHCKDQPPEMLKVFEPCQASKVLQNLLHEALSHCALLSSFKKFKKRSQQQILNIYIASPCSVLNSNQTPFTDLRKLKEDSTQEKPDERQTKS